MEGRPPDPYENDPTLSPNTLTEGNHITPPTVASKIDQTMKGTRTNITSASPNQATDFSGQNRVNLNHGIDSMILKTSMPTISATMVNPVSTSDQAKFSGDLHTGKHGAPAMKPIPNAHQNAQNIPYDHFPPLTSNFTQPHRKNYNPITTEKFGPPHVRSNAAENSQHDAYSDQPGNIGNVILNQSTALLQQKFNNINSSRDDSAKVSNPVNKPCVVPIPSRDDSAKVLNPVNKPCVVPIPTQQNVTMPPQPQPQSVKFPTVQQLNSKFNHFPHQPTQANQPNAGLTNLSNAVSTARNVPPPIPPNVIPSYATRLKASQPDVDQIVELQAPLITTKQGLPAVLFNRDDFMVKLASKCRFTLIGKFSTTMPKLEVIRKSLTSQLQIKGNCKVTHFNSTHVYIDLDNEIDHSIVWNKERIYIEGRSMRLLVWTPTFTPQVETTFAPVWVVLPELPWHCYTMPFVTKLLEPIGRVLFFDAASIQKTRGSVAKVKVEIDITKPRPPHLWLGFPQAEGDVFGDGRWQELQFESIPDYCNHCKHQGHSFYHCKVRIREEEYQKRKKDQEEKEIDKDPIQNTSSDQHRDQPEPSNQKVNKSSYERGQTTGTAIRPQARHQAIIAAKKIDIRNTVKQVYVPRNAAQATVSLVSQKIPTDTATVSDQRTLVNTKNSFDVLIDVDTAEVSDVATGNPVQDVPIHGNALACASFAPALTSSGLQFSFPATAMEVVNLPCEVINKSSGTAVTVPELRFAPVISKVSCHDVVQKDTGRESTQILDIVLQRNEKCVDTAGTSQTCPSKGPVFDKNSSQQLTVKDASLHHCVDSHDCVSIPSAIAPFPGKKDSQQMKPAIVENVQNAVHVQNAGYERPTANFTSDVESTKTWVMRSFGPTSVPDKVPCDKPATVVNTHHMPRRELDTDKPTAQASKSGKNPCVAVQKTKKQIGEKIDSTSDKGNKDEVTQHVQQQSEEEVRKAKIRAWQDAILAKSYAENPIIECNEPLNVLENRSADSIPSQQSFDPAYAITMGTDNDDSENDKGLAEYLSPAQSGNKLIPTTRLEVICKKASKALKEVGRGFFPVTHQAAPHHEGHEEPTYFLGDLFHDTQITQSTHSKCEKSQWNLDAPVFIPNYLRHHNAQIPVESVDSQEASKLPTGPSDEVLLKRLDLQDIRGLLYRQNSPPQELPQKFLSPHPGIIEDGSEYEDEDEDSTAYNHMAEARYAGLSPRLEQAVKPKLIKKKRRPLEPKKKEAAPKKPKRVQPTRSSKSRSSRRK